ncbi:hypothetical protein PV08_01505 [Exophiala spinifera]|uniref:Uncharacterized protein n=1 Tax=Exophiala spinifera TaxID=91928 RepID=A0A0D1Z042_9EURO|nr:uncharacterized protein PV08_01505 [Exophiala spinifera]KIW20926.1 hypothetical protein PV08_01505 [Exophiala spinifera]
MAIFERIHLLQSILLPRPRTNPAWQKAKMRFSFTATALLFGRLTLVSALPRVHVWMESQEQYDDSSDICDAADDTCSWRPPHLSHLQGAAMDELDLREGYFLDDQEANESNEAVVIVIHTPTRTSKNTVATAASPCHLRMVTSAQLQLQPRNAVPEPLEQVADIPKSIQQEESEAPVTVTTAPAPLVACGRWGSCPDGYDWFPFFQGCFCELKLTKTISVPNGA